MLLRAAYISIFLSTSVLAFAQRSEADSLESLVGSVPADTNKVWLLNKLVSHLREKDNNKALHFVQQAAHLSELLGYKRGLGHALENYGWILYRKGDYSKSLEVSTRGLRVSEELGDIRLKGKCLINIAAIYYEQDQFQQAIDHFRKAHEVAALANDELLIARCYNNIAYTYLGLHNVDSADWYVQRALTVSEDTGDAYMIAFARRTYGDIYLLRNNAKEALRHFNTCADLSFAHNNNFLKASVLHRLANTYFKMNAPDKAMQYLTENIALAERYGFKDELERAYRMAADIYHKKNDIVRAYKYQLAYINLHDSLYNLRSSEQIALMQIRFDTEMKQAQIELLTKEAELKAGEISRQRGWIYFYVLCLTLFIILAVIFFLHNRNNRKAKISLQEKNDAVELQALQLQNLNATKDKLFSIISHDLRSPVASLKALMDLISNSGLTQAEFIALSKTLKRNLDNVYEDLDNLLLWAQTQLKGLQASPEDFSLRKVADEKISLFHDIAERKKIVIHNGIPPDVFVCADRNHVGIVFRNLLANAIKFNHPGGSIRMESRDRAGYYEISITDSGVGMTEDDVRKLFTAETHFTTPGTHKEKGVGIGLLLTKEFIETNDGSIWVTSQSGKGTTFTFTLKASRVAVLA